MRPLLTNFCSQLSRLLSRFACNDLIELMSGSRNSQEDRTTTKHRRWWRPLPYMFCCVHAQFTGTHWMDSSSRWRYSAFVLQYINNFTDPGNISRIISTKESGEAKKNQRTTDSVDKRRENQPQSGLEFWRINKLARVVGMLWSNHSREQQKCVVSLSPYNMLAIYFRLSARQAS